MPSGPQFIDADFTDQFTDASVRYSFDGIQRLSMQNWKASVTVDAVTKIATIRVFFDNVLTAVNASKPYSLKLAGTLLRVRSPPDAAVASVAASSWVATAATGVYQVDLSALLTSGVYVVEVVMQTTFTNPAQTGKTSVITGASASYPATQTHEPSWVAASAFWQAPIFDAVGFATGLGFR